MAYYIVLPDGKVHTFYEGLTYDQVVAAAKNWGVDESAIQGGTPPTTPEPTPTTTPTQTPSPIATRDRPIPSPTTATPTVPTTPLTPEDWAAAKEKFGLQPGVAGQYSEEEQLDYIQYKQFTQTEEGQYWPDPASIDDFLSHIDEWATEVGTGEDARQNELQRQYNQYLLYMRQFAGLEDWRPTSFEDWLDNRDIADQQLADWGVQAEEAEEVDEYALDPAEAARRREEAYAESRYAAEERYRESPMYSGTFAEWIQGRGDMSGALEQYVEGRYPSLKAEYQAGMEPLTGYSTREEARAEASRRESGWQAWLGERMGETTQEYYGQRPQERGERMWMQQPTLRSANW